MYLVVSKWECEPQNRAQFEEAGKGLRQHLRSQPGVRMVETFEGENGGLFAVHGYDSEADYRRIVQDEAGPFAQAAAQANIDQYGKWVWSERGEAREHP